MLKSKSFKAIIARGVNSKIATDLCNNGYTLQKIQKENNNTLKEYGLSENEINVLKNSKRPPVPPITVNNLLHDAAYTCNICRDNELPIIIHHISPWANSHNHEYENLIVLCPNCHAKAHSVSTISTNLTKDRLKNSKKGWLEKVKGREINSLFKPPSWALGEGVWDYINHNRILDLAIANQIAINNVSGYNQLLANNLIAQDGTYIWPSNGLDPHKMNFMYEGGFAGPLRSLISFNMNILKSTLKKTNIKNISNNFRKSSVNGLTTENTILTMTGGHRFKRLSPHEQKGPGQRRKGYKKGRGLSVNFEIDAWETTSSSSHWHHLSGNWTCTSILLVRKIETSKKTTDIYTTCLAIGTGFGG